MNIATAEQVLVKRGKARDYAPFTELILQSSPMARSPIRSIASREGKVAVCPAETAIGIDGASESAHSSGTWNRDDLELLGSHARPQWVVGDFDELPLQVGSANFSDGRTD
jgi:hypothetical protein